MENFLILYSFETLQESRDILYHEYIKSNNVAESLHVLMHI